MQDTIFKDHLKSIRPLSDDDFNKLLEAQIERIEQRYPSGVHLVKQ